MKNWPSVPASPLAAAEPSPRCRTRWAGTGLSSHDGSPCRCTGQGGPAVTVPPTPVPPAAPPRVVDVTGAVVVVGAPEAPGVVVVSRVPGETVAVPEAPPETPAVDVEVSGDAVVVVVSSAFVPAA